jgi:glycosyltransferase involved in cell wall biosynthesis
MMATVTAMRPTASISASVPVSMSMRRHVVLLAPPWYPVPPRGYGGIEAVVALLTEELRARGHQVTLLAAEGSGHQATVHAPAAWAAALGQRDERLREVTYAARVLRTLRQLGGIDVIHDHVGFATLLGCLQLSSAPVLHTVHGVVREPDSTFYSALGDELALAAISESQRRPVPRLPWIGTVPNAVSLRHLAVGSRDEKEPYLLCLARICPDKGQHVAIEVAHRTGLRLVLAGKVEATADAREYFQRRIAPALDGTRVVHVSNVASFDKARLLARATALLAPIQWEEPFGLSVVEAMASGTPAISMARGAAPELIEEGETGFLVRDADEMVAAVRRASEIEPARCAAATRARFSPSVMVDGYLRLYAEVESTVAGNRDVPVVEAAAWQRLAGRQLQPGRAAAHDVEAAAVAVDADVA